MQNKTTVNLHGVPQTLLLPLLGRAKLSQEARSPFHDPKAVELVNTLNYDFASLSKTVGQASLFWMARAYCFDEAVKQYVQRHPKAVIVNLGAGLETAFHRVDNGQLTWIDLDLPEVIALRQQLLPQPQRVHTIVKSVLDFTWMDDVKQYGDDIFFFAGGLFVYFPEAQVKSIFTRMAEQFPQGELIFDVASQRGVYYANKMLQDAQMKDAVLKWGIDDGAVLETWSPKITLLRYHRYFQTLRATRSLPLFMRARMAFYDRVNRGGIVHLAFRG